MTFDLTYADRMNLNGAAKEEEKAKDEDAEKVDADQTISDEDDGDSSEERPVPLVATCFGSGVKNVNLSIR